MLKDYDMNIIYHPGKSNVVEDALSYMTMGCVSLFEEYKKDLVKDVHRLAILGVRLEDSPNGGFMVHRNSNLSLLVEVKSKQHIDQTLMDLKESVLGMPNKLFSLGVMVF